jgi:hypothetical protein
MAEPQTDAAQPLGAPATPAWMRAALDALAPIGLQRWGVAELPPGAGPLPGATHVLVIASGGPALWSAFEAAIRADPEVLRAEAHPLDAFVARALRAADPDPPASRRWVRCAADEPTFVDFRPLAVAAGLGWPGRLGLLMGPEDGPWLGLRAACFTVEPLPRAPSLAGRGPCGGCPAPCVAACPVGAPPAGPLGPTGAPLPFDIGACAGHRAAGGCRSACLSRNRCPEGATSRYSDREQAYHEDRVSGRPALAAALGLADDRHPGLGPPWADWARPLTTPPPPRGG